MPTPRRDFLGWLGGGALAASAGFPLRAHAREMPPLTARSTDFDMSWTDRVKGNHRAVFDSPEVSDGAAMFRAVIWGQQYKEVYGTEASDMTAVVVLRHAGIILAMDDSFWSEFEIGKEAKMKDEHGKKWATKNPIASAPPAKTPPEESSFNLPGLIGRGGIVLACNMAFSGCVSQFKTKHNVSDAEARKMAIAHLVPGVILQPSGVFAVLRAQEAGCHYLLAS